MGGGESSGIIDVGREVGRRTAEIHGHAQHLIRVGNAIHPSGYLFRAPVKLALKLRY